MWSFLEVLKLSGKEAVSAVSVPMVVCSERVLSPPPASQFNRITPGVAVLLVTIRHPAASTDRGRVGVFRSSERLS